MNQRTLGMARMAAICTAGLLVATACSSGGGGGGGTTGGTGGGAPVKGGTLNMLGTGDVDYMDQNISYYTVGYLSLRLWSRQLFTNPAVKGHTTDVVPDLATKLPTSSNGGISADGKTYTITLKKGVRWNTSPARQVTAADVVRGVKRTCNPVQPFGGIPDFATLLEGYQTFCDGFSKVKGTPSAIAQYINSTPLPAVEAKGQQTVVFHLTHPASYFVDMLTMPAFSPAPAEILKYLPASQQLGQHQISDGPYQIESWNPTKSIVFTRNPAWDPATDHVRKAYVDKIVVNETVTQESEQQQLETGTPSADMGFATGPPPSQYARLLASNDPKFVLGQTPQTNPYIVFNMASPNNSGALGNLKVRQALEYGINRSHIIQVLGGPQINPPLTHVLPPSIEGSQNFDLYKFDTGKAKQLLKQAGYAKGLTLKYLYRPSSEADRKTFATVQQDLSNIGVHVVGVTSPDADFYTKYLTQPDTARNGTWDVAAAGWIADWNGNAALSFFAPLFSGKPSFPPIGSNFSFYSSPTTNALVDQASRTASKQKSLSLWAQADKQVMKDAAFFPITAPRDPHYHAQQVNNAVYLSNVADFDPTVLWLSPGMQGG